MANTHLKIYPFLLLALLLILIPAELIQATQININELLQANPPTEVIKEGPVIRVKRPVLPVEDPPIQDEPVLRLPTRKIALTFDDGPDSKHTLEILEILKKEQILATFFVVGNQVERYPEMIKHIFRDGHLIANHSRTHTDFSTLSNEEIINFELGPTSRAVEQLTGYYPMIMRPPYGSLRPDSLRFLNKEGWRIVRWSLDTFDWDSTRNRPKEIINRILEQHHPNAIVLMHCNGPATVKALPDIINTLRVLGYEFVTVNQL